MEGNSGTVAAVAASAGLRAGHVTPSRSAHEASSSGAPATTPSMPRTGVPMRAAAYQQSCRRKTEAFSNVYSSPKATQRAKSGYRIGLEIAEI
jgi:hypothetical protein